MLICVSSLVRCLLRQLANFFFIALLVFLLLIFQSSLYVLDNSSLSDVSFANIFSQSVWLLFSFFDGVFAITEAFNSNKI